LTGAGEAMPTIVISYRREDTGPISGRLFDRLEDHFGKQSVFMDIDAIPVGTDFRDHIAHVLERCDILLAVIGRNWLGSQGADGAARLADETDWVRIEIETALNKKVVVIPVLIDRAPMPKPEQLPPSLRDLAFRNAAMVDTGLDFRPHTDRLIRALDGYLAAKAAPPAAAIVADLPARKQPEPRDEPAEPDRAAEAHDAPLAVPSGEAPHAAMRALRSKAPRLTDFTLTGLTPSVRLRRALAMMAVGGIATFLAFNLHNSARGPNAPATIAFAALGAFALAWPILRWKLQRDPESSWLVYVFGLGFSLKTLIAFVAITFDAYLITDSANDGHPPSLLIGVFMAAFIFTAAVAVWIVLLLLGRLLRAVRTFLAI
jgi:TIR domain-containing protein